MDKDKTIALLNEAIENEHGAIIQYLSHAYGMGEGEMSCEIEAVAREEMRHLDWLAEAVVELGGVPSFKRGAMRMGGAAVSEWMGNDVLLEEDAINLYKKDIAAVSDPKLKRLFERILADEESHHGNFRHFVDKSKKEGAKDVRGSRQNETTRLLNWGIEHEYTVIIQYLLHSYLTLDKEVKRQMQDQAINEMQHLGWLAEEMVDGGGTPQIEHSEYDRSTQTADMLRADIAIEKQVAAEYDRAAREATLLFTNQPKLESLPLAQMQPVSLPSRDGLTLRGYLSTPVGLAGDKPPAVLFVHGGPWGRDTWGFQPWVQWLANRGYAVLQVNFRGSAGYGKAFLNAGNREWAGKMHDDLIDAVRWVVDEGIADPKRVAIMGGSFGGYATLVGLTFTPDVFAAGVDIVGPSSLATLLRNIPPYWEPVRPMLTYRVGDVETEEEFLKSRSPLFFAERITRPLLIGQGANDPRVKQAESDQIVETMRKSGKPVEYVVYTDEGHGFARPENRLHFYARAEQFLARYLGGRAEPPGEIAAHSGEDR